MEFAFLMILRYHYHYHYSYPSLSLFHAPLYSTCLPGKQAGIVVSLSFISFLSFSFQSFPFLSLSPGRTGLRWGMNACGINVGMVLVLVLVLDGLASLSKVHYSYGICKMGGVRMG